LCSGTYGEPPQRPSTSSDDAPITRNVACVRPPFNRVGHYRLSRERVGNRTSHREIAPGGLLAFRHELPGASHTDPARHQTGLRFVRCAILARRVASSASSHAAAKRSSCSRRSYTVLRPTPAALAAGATSPELLSAAMNSDAQSVWNLRRDGPEILWNPWESCTGCAVIDWHPQRQARASVGAGTRADQASDRTRHRAGAGRRRRRRCRAGSARGEACCPVAGVVVRR